MLRIYPSLKLSGAAATLNGSHARCANTVRIGSAPSHGLYTTWEIHSPGIPVTLLLHILNTAVPNATITSMPTWTIWRYPKAIIRIEWFRWQCGLLWRMVFGEIKHQSCQFHIINEITKDILKAVTQVRRRLKQKKTERPRGRPSGQRAKQLAQKNQRLQNKIADLFEYRYLFVKHTLTHKEKKILHRKMKKSIYRVRTRDHISQRIAVDMQRDVYTDGLKKTISTLHWSRNGEKRKAG